MTPLEQAREAVMLAHQALTAVQFAANADRKLTGQKTIDPRYRQALEHLQRRVEATHSHLSRMEALSSAT